MGWSLARAAWKVSSSATATSPGRADRTIPSALASTSTRTAGPSSRGTATSCLIDHPRHRPQTGTRSVGQQRPKGELGTLRSLRAIWTIQLGYYAVPMGSIQGSCLGRALHWPGSSNPTVRTTPQPPGDRLSDVIAQAYGRHQSGLTGYPSVLVVAGLTGALAASSNTQSAAQGQHRYHNA